LQGQLDASKRRLNILLGQYPSVSLDQNLSAGSNLLPFEVSQSSPGSLLANRPDLLAAEQKAQASGLDLSVARKNFFPSLSVSGGPGSRSDEFENLLDNNFRTWGINGSLSQPLFNGGRLRAAHRQAKALQAAAWADYRSHALNAFVEVENVLAAEIRLAEQETLIELAAQSAEEASKLSWERYQRGVEAIFNALENQRRAFDARSQVYLIRKQRVHNRIDLHLSLGQLPLSE
jgi:multidrug efflux system outer membrane protein